MQQVDRSGEYTVSFGTNLYCGERQKLKVLETGNFHCPNCRSGLTNLTTHYKLKERFVSCHFCWAVTCAGISKGKYVKCSRCNVHFKTEVLEWSKILEEQKTKLPKKTLTHLEQKLIQAMVRSVLAFGTCGWQKLLAIKRELETLVFADESSKTTPFSAFSIDTVMDAASKTICTEDIRLDYEFLVFGLDADEKRYLFKTILHLFEAEYTKGITTGIVGMLNTIAPALNVDQYQLQALPKNGAAGRKEINSSPQINVPRCATKLLLLALIVALGKENMEYRIPE